MVTGMKYNKFYKKANNVFIRVLKYFTVEEVITQIENSNLQHFSHCELLWSPAIVSR